MPSTAYQTEPEKIGGGVVARPFDMGGVRLKTGTQLTAEQIMGIRRTNRRVLIENGHLRVWPAHAPAEGMVRHVIGRGAGKFDVIEGVKLNDAPLSKEEALALAGAPAEPATAAAETLQ